MNLLKVYRANMGVKGEYRWIRWIWGVNRGNGIYRRYIGQIWMYNGVYCELVGFGE